CARGGIPSRPKSGGAADGCLESRRPIRPEALQDCVPHRWFFSWLSPGTMDTMRSGEHDVGLRTSTTRGVTLHTSAVRQSCGERLLARRSHVTHARVGLHCWGVKPEVNCEEPNPMRRAGCDPSHLCGDCNSIRPGCAETAARCTVCPDSARSRRRDVEAGRPEAR